MSVWGIVFRALWPDPTPPAVADLERVADEKAARAAMLARGASLADVLTDLGGELRG